MEHQFLSKRTFRGVCHLCVVHLVLVELIAITTTVNVEKECFFFVCVIFQKESNIEHKALSLSLSLNCIILFRDGN